MSNVSQMIKTAARNKGVRQDIVEKDYSTRVIGPVQQLDDLMEMAVRRRSTSLRLEVNGHSGRRAVGSRKQ